MAGINDIPAAFARSRYTSLAEASLGRNPGQKFRRQVINLDGQGSSGKTELALSAPGWGIGVCIDRNLDGALNNAAPPPTRRKDWVFRVIDPPIITAATQNEFNAAWVNIRSECYAAANMPESRSVLIDGDSIGWEIQRMSTFGRIHQVPSHLYTTANAERRAFYNKLRDSGKIIIMTDMVKQEYKTKIDPITLQPVMKDNKEVREWTGHYERQGFSDKEYVCDIQLHCMYQAGSLADGVETPGTFGARITLCKSNRGLEGDELWGADCNLPSLFQHIYPHIPLKEWGY